MTGPATQSRAIEHAQDPLQSTWLAGPEHAAAGHRIDDARDADQLGRERAIDHRLDREVVHEIGAQSLWHAREPREIGQIP